MIATLEAPDVLTQMARKGEQAYRALVMSMAEGEAPTVEEIRAVLIDSGRSRQDLERHLSLAKQRKQAADMLAGLDGVQADYAQACARSNAARQRIADAQAEYDLITAEPQAKLKAIRLECEKVVQDHYSTIRALVDKIDRNEREARQVLNRTRSRKVDETRSAIGYRIVALSDDIGRLHASINTLTPHDFASKLAEARYLLESALAPDKAAAKATVQNLEQAEREAAALREQAKTLEARQSEMMAEQDAAADGAFDWRVFDLD